MIGKSHHLSSSSLYIHLRFYCMTFFYYPFFLMTIFLVISPIGILLRGCIWNLHAPGMLQAMPLRNGEHWHTADAGKRPRTDECSHITDVARARQQIILNCDHLLTWNLSPPFVKEKISTKTSRIPVHRPKVFSLHFGMEQPRIADDLNNILFMTIFQ